MRTPAAGWSRMRPVAIWLRRHEPVFRPVAESGAGPPAQALDLQGLYEHALTASRQGDFVEALPLWDRFLEQALRMQQR